MTIKRPKRKAKTPTKAPSKPVEPSKAIEAPPVAPPPSPEPYRPMDWESIYGRLSYQGKMKAKYAAEQRGVTLRTLLERWPQFRQG